MQKRRLSLVVVVYQRKYQEEPSDHLAKTLQKSYIKKEEEKDCNQSDENEQINAHDRGTYFMPYLDNSEKLNMK